MKILMISPHAIKIKGGMSTVIKNYINYNNQKNLEIIYLYTTDGGSNVRKLLYLIKSILSFFKILFLNDVDIVHIHIASGVSFYRKSIFCLLSKAFNIEYILHLHGGGFDEFYSKQSKLIKEYINYVFNKSVKVIVLSDNWIKIVKKYCNTEVVVLRNAINVPQYNNYKSDKKNILMLGRLTAKKGIYDLLDIAEVILSKDSDVTFLIGGDGEINKVQRIIKEKNIEKGIKLLGWIDEKTIQSLLKETMIYILPSYYEAMPMSILEAMSYGIPIISTKVGSIPEIIKNNENGYLLNPGDIEGFCKKIMKILKDKQLRHKMSTNNLNYVLKENNIENNIQTLYSIYKDLI